MMQPLVDKEDFPLLAGDPDLVYLDSAATTQKPRVMIEAVDNFYRTSNANTGRGLYPLATRADEIYQEAHRAAAQFVGSRPEQTVFTSSATASINLVAYSWGTQMIGSGDAIVTTVAEHHSNLLPWQRLIERSGARLLFLDIDNSGRLSLDQLRGYLNDNHVRLVALTAVSNVLATINPVDEVTALAHSHGAAVLIDGSQAVPQMPVDVGKADFYVWGGHKSYGPMGIGVLHIKPERLEEMEPFLTGGGMVKTVDDYQAQFLSGSVGLEAGTQPVAEAHGLAAAIGYLQGVGMERVAAYEAKLVGLLLDRLSQVPGVKIYGPSDKRAALAAFSLPYAHPHDIAEVLGRDGVCIRAGTQCAQPLHRRLGIPATARVSLGLYNDEGDIEAFLASLNKVVRLFA